MPSKINPNDWDRYFSSSGPRRSGLVSLLVQTFIVVAVGAGLVYGLMLLNTNLQAKNVVRGQTGTARSLTQVVTRSKTQTAAALPTSAPQLPTGRVLIQTPIRDIPNVDGVSKGDVFANSTVAFIESKDVNNETWWLVRVIDQSNPLSAAPGTEGWMPKTSLGEPTGVTTSTDPNTPPGPTSVPEAPLVTLDAASQDLRRDDATNISVKIDRSWGRNALAGFDLGAFFAPAPDAGQGVAVAKVLNLTQDSAGFQSAVLQIAQALGKPNVVPIITVTASDAQRTTGTITWVRNVGGVDYEMQGSFMAVPAPGGSVGVALAFVPRNSFAQNEAILTQTAQGAIFQ